MTSGGMTATQAAKLQTFTRVKNCKPSVVKRYKGIYPPRCGGGKGCEKCWEKWNEVNQ